MQALLRLLCCGAACAALPVFADPVLPAPLQAALKASGVPLDHVGVVVQPVDDAAALAAWNADRPFTLASTAKVVTSLAALKLLGSRHVWRFRAVSTGPLEAGRLDGDLVISGPEAGLTADDLRRWFKQMRAEGLNEVRGRIVLRGITLLQDAPVGVAQAREGGGADPAPQIAVSVGPGRGALAGVELRPALPGVQLINEVAMGGGCAVYARWKAPPTRDGRGIAWVSGRWDKGCAKRNAAMLPLAAPLATPAAPSSVPSSAATIAGLWKEAGGSLRGGVIEAPAAATPAPAGWTSELSTSLPERLREINKASLNSGAQRLLLSLATGTSGPGDALHRARARLQAWLRGEGLADDDIRIELGSGQSHNERGKPRALVRLLQRAWAQGGAYPFIASLPLAGVDGTLAQRLRQGPAAGRAYLKTGTLNDTRALAGYVSGRSGRVYALVAIVNDARAANATPALDALVEWVAANG
jgi:D-alanyl-D-alanine carboxypeptidase/D-alanyl-D-alanine-endopeptidase (penicillin-binding protein 4)